MDAKNLPSSVTKRSSVWNVADKVAMGYGFTLWAGVLLYWIRLRPGAQLQDQLMRLTPYFFWVGLLVIGFAMLWSGPDLGSFLSSISKRDWIFMGGIAFLALMLVRGVAPRTHRIFYDEDLYQEIGLNLAQNNLAATSHDGIWEFGRYRERRPSYNKQPNSWPFLINLGFRLFGVSENVAYSLNNVLFLFTTVLLFLCGTMIFDSAAAGLFSALIFALIPENILWFSTVAVEPSAACFGLLAVTIAGLWIRSRSSGALFLTLTCTAFAVQFRPEAIIIAGIVAMILALEGDGILRHPLFAKCSLVFAFLVMGHLVHLYAMSGESWGSPGSKLSISYVMHNFLTNGAYYINDHRFPVFFTLLAVGGAADKSRWRSNFPLITWFLAYAGIFLFFYAGSYSYGADVRFALLTFAPLSLLAGWGTIRLLNWIQHYLRSASALGVILVLLGGVLIFKMPLLRAVGEEAWQAREDHDAAQSMASELPADAFVMSQDPCMFHLWGRNGAQLYLFENDPTYVNREIISRFGDRLYLHWGYWCNTDSPGERAYAQFVLDHYRTTLVSERKIRNVRYAMYRIGDPTSSPNSKTTLVAPH
jgi:hypothetical protein